MKKTTSLETKIKKSLTKTTESQAPVFDIFSEILSFKESINTTNDINEFTNKLIKLAGKISAEEEKLLFYFLQTSLNYIKDFYSVNDHNLRTLGLFVKFLENDVNYNDSVFDQMIKKAIQKLHFKKRKTLKVYYKQFLEVRNENSSKIINTLYWEIFRNYQLS